MLQGLLRLGFLPTLFTNLQVLQIWITGSSDDPLPILISFLERTPILHTLFIRKRVFYTNINRVVFIYHLSFLSNTVILFIYFFNLTIFLMVLLILLVGDCRKMIEPLDDGNHKMSCFCKIWKMSRSSSWVKGRMS